MQTEWISVKDKLPDKEGIYLVVKFSPITEEYDYDLELYKEYANCFAWWKKLGDDTIVTHWLPIPELPKGE